MEILNIDFEKSATIELASGEKITITPFREPDPSVIKLGIDAPRSVRVNREEVQRALERGEIES